MALDDQPVEEPRKRRWPSRWSIIEIAVVAAAVAMAALTYVVLSNNNDTQRLLSPGIAALLLLGDLIPVVGIIVMIGRRVARRRAAQLSGTGGGKLHVRLVAIFSLIASVPIVLTVIAASVMFQSVNQFWASNRAANAFNATISLVEDAQYQFIKRWTGEARLMANDIGNNRDLYPIGTAKGHQYLLYETYNRSLNQAVLFNYAGKDGVNVVDVWNAPDDKTFFSRVTPELLKTLHKDEKPFINYTPDTVWVVTKVPDIDSLYLYVGTGVDAGFLNRQHMAASDVLRDFKSLQGHSHALQLRFNAALFGVAVLIVALTMWIALVVADRLVRPVNQLAGAARRVAEGDLAVRVPEPTTDDEVGTLGVAFNAMTQRLEAQTSALENRRALIEAVMSGVTAGVISIDTARTVQLVNSSAASMLGAERDPVGQPLAAVAPELDAMLDSGQSEAIIQVAAEGEPKTLAVKVTGDAAGQVLTFDDITQQLLDQRRAAWSDVARRIAHEIKNPLTPIQLAAERLQRRYGKQFDGQDATFNRLTETIVRQVGDLRRMVDEFSSFARMPKPVFREESLVDIGRQALFLHEVAHPNVSFRLDYDEPAPMLVCDRRQIGQALTNIVKNAVEAIEAKGEEAKGEIVMTLAEDDASTTIVVTDDGVGLPSERSRLVEPYMTTRARGTGLGLAIVKKIAEEHFGEITFADRPGGGTIVTMRFDTRMLAAIDASGATPEASADDAPLPALTRNRNN
ncbi:sensor histidine kinase NtrY-like [Hephaestia mangrovi]|uniref:sensor histidine kinase NtrY-like n=1 Tax=Hephaestia mangrovi TaxID=2873268 RepID=UPI001CA614BF|nr:ATP-binding protein [Hephaestia mangrovi]MBY8827890.1 HAMP domain-containing protein [Hephaestia mangrovi]